MKIDVAHFSEQELITSAAVVDACQSLSLRKRDAQKVTDFCEAERSSRSGIAPSLSVDAFRRSRDGRPQARERPCGGAASEPHCFMGLLHVLHAPLHVVCLHRSF
jgi:hypothetical protein